jgi:hypothetical protein
MSIPDKTLLESKIKKTFTLVEASVILKMAHLKARHPGSSESQIKDMFFDDMLKRKEKQWKALISSSKR